MKTRNQTLIIGALACAVSAAVFADYERTTLNQYSSAFDVAVGDVDGDGNLDLVSPGIYEGGWINVMRGNGDGTFQPYSKYANTYVSQARALALGDVNNDGKADVVIADSYANQISVFLNDGHGAYPRAFFNKNFNTAARFNGLSDLKLADVNNDGKLDLVATSSWSNQVYVLTGDGSGRFNTVVTLTAGKGADTSSVADLNLDGRLDIVTANVTDGTVSVFLNSSNGFASAQNYPAGPHPRSVSIGDVTGDGKPDMVTTNIITDPATGAPLSGALTVMLGDGSGTFLSLSTIPTTAAGISSVLVDTNHDGQIDILVGFSVPGGVGVFLNQGNGVFNGYRTVSTLPKTGSSVDAVAVADFNHDGSLDFVTSDGTQNFLELFIDTASQDALAAAATQAKSSCAADTADKLQALIDAAVATTKAEDSATLSAALATAKSHCDADLAAALASAQSKFESDLANALADAKAQADADKAAALLDAQAKASAALQGALSEAKANFEIALAAALANAKATADATLAATIAAIQTTDNALIAAANARAVAAETALAKLTAVTQNCATVSSEHEKDDDEHEGHHDDNPSKLKLKTIDLGKTKGTAGRK
jgi:hypothetical protein